MKRVKIISMVAVLLLTEGLFSGCSGENAQAPSYVDVGALNNYSVSQITQINFGENSENSSLETESSNITPSVSSSTGSAQIESNTNSNPENDPQDNDKSAEIIIPTTTEYNVCTAEYSIFDPEKVKAALLPNTDVTPVVRDFSKDDPYYKYPMYDWTIGNTSLDVDNNSHIITLSSDLSALIRYIIALPNHNSDGNVEKFKNRNNDLDFCTREQAIKSVKETLFKMDVAVSENADIYAFNQSDLQAYINKRIEERSFYDPKASVKDQNAKPLTFYNVDKSQECYYIVFREEYKNVPIYNQNFGYRTITDLTVFHPEIIAIYSSDGLVGLSVCDYRGNISKTDIVTRLITPESAAQSVAAKFKDVVGMEQATFDKVELMYVITPNYIDGKINMDKALMTPVWVCTIRYNQLTYDRNTQSYCTVHFKETVLIDAQTGKEII